jgi:hypothetical protein
LWPGPKAIASIASSILEEAHRTKIWDGKVKHARKTGAELLVSVSISLRGNAQGKTSGFTLAARKISERERFEETLQDFLEAAPDAMFVVNVQRMSCAVWKGAGR